MKTGQTFDLVQITGDTPGYGCALEIGQQCSSEPGQVSPLVNVHYVKFNYGHHPNPIAFYPQDVKKIGKLTVTKIK